MSGVEKTVVRKVWGRAQFGFGIFVQNAQKVRAWRGVVPSRASEIECFGAVRAVYVHN